MLVDNHTIPLWREVHFEDMVFGVFPFVGETLENCYAPWIQNSFGDIIDMILQALEVRYLGWYDVQPFLVTD